jgi:hypothetical protein
MKRGHTIQQRGNSQGFLYLLVPALLKLLAYLTGVGDKEFAMETKPNWVQRQIAY